MQSQHASEREIVVDGNAVFVRISGRGPPLLLLHGFPETSLMWRDVAPLLGDHFTVICADLRGYGRSGCPPSSEDHLPYSKRVMATELAGAMEALGYPRFAAAGHDRGGRVAYRLALDHPERVSRLAVLDVVPTADVWDLADDRLALAFWPWSLLAQPAPLPERLISGSPRAVIEDALQNWGSHMTAEPAVVEAYVDMLRDPARVHAICEEYRAAAAIDRDHDATDRASGRSIDCPTLVLWDAAGALSAWYEDRGGPLGLWRSWGKDVRGHAMTGGHFFPEANPEATARVLSAFFGSDGESDPAEEQAP